MKVVNIPTYQFEDGTIVQFFKVNDIPGFSHKVIINRISVKDYLGDSFRPSQKAAIYFYEKHVLKTKTVKK